ncbi:hypothetical protein VTK73DRAFT_7061 [Phialemonium thermophilum]|uniref:Uncharacterized protein n=1 Tax=Phialemonium thermophilum TaxID=223376 RepID=A0ABR3WGK0_9PEZI
MNLCEEPRQCLFAPMRRTMKRVASSEGYWDVAPLSHSPRLPVFVISKLLPPHPTKNLLVASAAQFKLSPTCHFDSDHRYTP